MAASGISGKYFGSNEQLTAAKLHQIIESASITGFDQTNMASGAGLVISSATSPSDTDALWFDTNLNLLRFYNGTVWSPVSGGEVVTNKSGGSLARGDVVIWDVTNDLSVTTTSRTLDVWFAGIAAGTIANNASGVIITSGLFVVNLINSITNDGTSRYLGTTTTPKKAVATLTTNPSSLGHWGRPLPITTSADLVPCFLWGQIPI